MYKKKIIQIIERGQFEVGRCALASLVQYNLKYSHPYPQSLFFLSSLLAEYTHKKSGYTFP